jgi:hypothetical protein
MNTAQILASLAAQAAQGVRTNTPADGYVQAAAKLMEHASRWSAVSASGLKCSITMVTPQSNHVRCVTPAIGVCVVCDNPVCFGHAMISPSNGDMVCYGCIARMTGASPNPKQETPPKTADASPQCNCQEPWKLSPQCPVHGRQSNDDLGRMRRKHLRALELDEDADWEDVQFAYKQLVKKHHPDRHPPTRKKRQESRIKKINAAFTWLKKHYEEAA